MKSLNYLARYRQTGPDIIQIFGSTGDEHNGVFIIPSPVNREDLRIIASADADLGGWDHVSVSLAGRSPIWQEMDYVHRMFFKPDEVCMQLHVPVKEHINIHPYTLHIWRPWVTKIPLPPSEYV